MRIRRRVLGPFVVALTLLAVQEPSAQDAPPPGVMFARSARPTPRATASGEPAREASLAANGAFDDTVLPQTGLDDPTVIRFAPDGRLFVAEKSGRIKVFDDVDDPSSTLVADLHVNVHNFWDRGLLGMELDSNFPTVPRLYVFYTYDAAPGGSAPRWGTGSLGDGCPTPPGPTTEGCVVTGRLSRIDIGNPAAWPLGPGDEVPLITDWFQQFPSHSVGSLIFGADGALYASAGEGASFLFPDSGQIPADPSSGDPVDEGGALRAQDIRTSGDPAGLSGTIIRVDPNTGLALPDNPRYGLTTDPNGRRIIGSGLRNPFRIAMRPGTSELWIGDAGWRNWEEINRMPDPLDGTVENFGWPCYEGHFRQSGYDGFDLPICESLYGEGTGAVAAPHFTYERDDQVVPGEPCPVGSASVSGLAFYEGGSYPSSYIGALFFADYSRNCVWAMSVGAGGVPDPGNIVTVSSTGGGPVDLVVGPGGDIFYPGFDDDQLHRIQYFSGDQPPTAMIAANPTSGPAPLVVNFDGSGSTDPEGLPLTYAWDLDGDGAFDDSTSPTPTHTYVSGGVVTVGLRVTDAATLSDVTTVAISINNSSPVAIIDTPIGALTWKVGDPITFSGRAADPDAPGGFLPASGLSWQLIMHHCPSNCHTHTVQSFDNVAGGSFTSPDHEYPSHLELKLTATDGEGLQSTASVLLHPRTVTLTFQTQPPGLRLAMNAETIATPFTRTVIIGSANGIGAPSPQPGNPLPYQFVAWSDGGAQNHTVIAPATPITYVATFAMPPLPTEVCGDGVDNDGNGVVDDHCGATPPALPGVPARLTGRVDGTTVGLSWLAPITGGPSSGYVLEAGATPGAATFQFPLGSATALSVPGVPAGRYYVRVRAVNVSGASAPSNEAVVTVGCTTRPGPPALTSAVNGALVSLTWTDADGCSGTTYRLLVGAQPGTANLAQIPVAASSFSAAAPAGTYYVRVVADTPLGSSDPSNEVALTVGAGCTPLAIPIALETTLLGSLVELRWNPVVPATAIAADAFWPLSYNLEIGSAAGVADFGAIPLGRVTSLQAQAPSGQLYVRVRPVDQCGAGQPSNDRVIVVP